MSSIRRERRDPLPLTWELPAAATLAWVAVAATLLPAARGAATWLTGAGWVWPKQGTGLTVSLAGLLTGHPGAGLTTADATRLPASGVVYLLVVLAEVAWLILSLLAAGIWWRTWGPGTHEGLADRFEVEKVLGRSRIRRDRKVIRPDLYGKRRRIGGRS
ncbi:MAG: conjugal transfer protein [Actinomycetota bacterium]